MKKLIKDEMSVRLGLSLIELQLFNVPLMLVRPTTHETILF